MLSSARHEGAPRGPEGDIEGRLPELDVLVSPPFLTSCAPMLSENVDYFSFF